MKNFVLPLILFCISISSAQAGEYQITHDYQHPDSEKRLGIEISEISAEKWLFMANLAGTTAAGIGAMKLDPSQDKTRHFLAGYVVGNISNGLSQLMLPDDVKNRRLVSALVGVASSILVGIGKEVIDSRGRGNASIADALATGAGGIVGSLTISFDLEKAIL